MKFKTKYKFGDAIAYYDKYTHKISAGTICNVRVNFGHDTMCNQEVIYIVDGIRFHIDYSGFFIIPQEVNQKDVLRKLNATAFDEEFSKQCARGVWGNSIFPNFRIGQTVWYLIPNRYRDGEIAICRGRIKEISVRKMLNDDDESVLTYKFEGSPNYILEKDIFHTEDEAEDSLIKRNAEEEDDG